MKKKQLLAMSAALDRDLSGDVDKTKPLSIAERKWFIAAVEEIGPKRQTTIRLRKWQIDFARDFARRNHLRGYQTAIEKILTRAMLNPEFVGRL